MPTPTADTYTAASGATLQGGRGTPPSGLPTWVPTTAWQWADIPSSTWTSYMKDDGTGIVPLMTGEDPGPTRSYVAQWDYGGPCYSRANHEVWVYGGGHAGTTVNAVSRWNLNKNSPDVSLASAPSSVAVRNTYLLAETWRTTMYFSDGKPFPPHMYNNAQYLDALDEFIVFGFSDTASGYPTASGGAQGSRDVAGLPRAGSWRADNHYADVPTGVNPQPRGPRISSADGAAIYYWDAADGADSVDLRKWVAGTNTHSIVGASSIPWYSRQEDGGAGVALVMGGADSAAGWQAKFVNLTSGATVAVTVSGDSIPSGLYCFDVTWCPARGYYVAVWFNSSAQFGGAAVTAACVATITPTGSNTATASIKTMTGTAPVFALGRGGAFYDPTFDAVIVVQGHSQPLKVLKVA